MGKLLTIFFNFLAFFHKKLPVTNGLQWIGEDWVLNMVLGGISHKASNFKATLDFPPRAFLIAMCNTIPAEASHCIATVQYSVEDGHWHNFG